MDSEERLDSIVTEIIYKFRERAILGKIKYGTDLDRKDLSISDWIKHAQEEHMDAILYLEKIKKEMMEIKEESKLELKKEEKD